MKQYDVKCPVCGTVNKGLYLEETDGRMICEHCNTESQDIAFMTHGMVTLPLLSWNQLPAYLARKAV
ncbi:MAG: hypothetical protein J5854_02380 [Clostridia bacterium]|nr:hypothetical protein [Clostridia bacterium]